MEKQLLATLAVILGLSEADVKTKAEAEDGSKELLDLHKQKLTEKEASVKTAAEKEAKKTAAAELSEALKAKFKVTTDKEGLALVEELVASAGKDKKAGAVSEDDVKKHPAYLELERTSGDKIKALETEKETAVKEVESTYAKKERLKGIGNLGVQILTDELKALLPADAQKAALRTGQLVKALEGFDYEVDANGKPIAILGPDGKRLEDGHANAKKFADFVKETADSLAFEYKVAEDRSSTGDNSESGKGGANENTFTGDLPKTDKAYYDLITDKTKPAAYREDLMKKVAEAKTAGTLTY